VEGRPLDDAELVELSRGGDVDAYRELVERYQGIAFRTAYVIVGSAADAEDVAQEAFVKAYYAMGRFRAGAAFRPWLLTIVANEARNRRRSVGRRESLALRLSQGRTSGGAAPSPEAAAIHHERDAILMGALNGLSDADRKVLACRYFLGLTETETASALGVARGTVKSRSSRALKRLREQLGPAGFEALSPVAESDDE
jgi:RNA polymerase sigma-70 factor (ECF subfamily)